MTAYARLVKMHSAETAGESGVGGLASFAEKRAVNWDS
jgi:hypothetical protein